MDRKDMIIRYCYMYVDVLGFHPDKDLVEKLPDKQLKILYDQMGLLFEAKKGYKY